MQPTAFGARLISQSSRFSKHEGLEGDVTAELLEQGVLEIGDGYRAKNSEFVKGGGLPFVRVGDIGHTIRLDSLDELPVADAAKYGLKVSRVADSLITMKGTVGRVAFVSAGCRPFVYSPQISYWRSLDAETIDPRWLRYWLESPEFLTQALASKGATDMADYINLRDQRRMRITLPPAPSQRQTADVLGMLDDLIQNNRRRIELLEKMTRAIYQEWFVHLRYPGHESATFVDSPLGPLPKAWSVRNLFDVAHVTFGFSFKSSRFAPTGPYPVVRIRDVPDGETKTFSDEKPEDRYRIDDGDVLIGMDGDFHLRQWFGGEAWLNQRVARLRPLGGVAARHLLLAIEKQIQEWNEVIIGTTVAHLGKRHLEQIRIVVPSGEVGALAARVFGDAVEQERLLIQSNRQLKGIRRLLLPRLVTGLIDVSEVVLNSVVELAG